MALKSSMKILIADASAGNRQILKKMLFDIGLKNVQEAADEERAWEKITAEEEKPVAFVISEWDLAKGTGLGLLKRIRESEITKRTKFLMVTGEAAQQNVVIAVKSGVNNVVVRPFSANTLMDKISKIFNQS